MCDPARSGRARAVGRTTARTGPSSRPSLCAETPLGKEWLTLRAEAESRFPGLRLSQVEDLHVTVVYIGGDWKAKDLEAIRAHALPGPREVVSFRPEVVRMGRDGHVVAVEMRGAPETRVAIPVVAAKGDLNRLGLKKADRYDAEFRPHVTLASARQSPPDATEAASLDGLRSWLAQKVAEDAGRFRCSSVPKLRSASGSPGRSDRRAHQSMSTSTRFSLTPDRPRAQVGTITEGLHLRDRRARVVRARMQRQVRVGDVPGPGREERWKRST